MAIFNNSIIPAAAAAADDVVTKSLRFDRASSSKLTRTFGTPTSQRKVTISWWMKLAEQGDGSTSYCAVISTGSGYQNYTAVKLDGGASNPITFEEVAGGSYISNRSTSRAFRDMGAWMHCVHVIDTTDSTADDRSKLYINGARYEGPFGTSYATYTLNYDTNWSASGEEIGIGLDIATAGPYFGGYLADIHYIDGQALTPSSFAEEDGDTGQWKPKAFVGVYGNNGFHLPFTDSTTSLTMVDSSSSAHVVTTNGADHDMAQNKIGNSSIYFAGDPNGSGDGDKLSIPASSDFDFGTGDFTIEMWIRPVDSGAGSYVHMFELYDSSTDRMYLRIERQGGNDRYDLTCEPSGGTATTTSSDSAPNYGNWEHLAVVRSSGTITMYVDGVAQADTETNTSALDYDSSLYIGWERITGDQFLEGYLDEYRISDTARYTSGFTPSTTAFVNDSNTKLLIHSDYLGGIGADTSVDTYLTATGGTVTTDGDYKIHTFNSTGTFEVTNTTNAPVEYLVIAGGAGGGTQSGGGGGAGGYLTATGLSATQQSYTVTVGGGGAGSTVYTATGASGSDSTFSTITSDGGGGGGSSTHYIYGSEDGLDGGSGGGANPFGSAGSATSGQGYNGGTGGDGGGLNFGSGGGGGAGAVGGNGDSSQNGGDGGAGVASSITGASVARGGGGGGCSGSSSLTGEGGNGGGGDAGYYTASSTSGTDGETNKGSGGGGGGGGSEVGGAGGSGVVIIRYKYQ